MHFLRSYFVINIFNFLFLLEYTIFLKLNYETLSNSANIYNRIMLRFLIISCDSFSYMPMLSWEIIAAKLFKYITMIFSSLRGNW